MMEAKAQSIFIVEDNDLVREGYVSLIDFMPDLTVAGEAATAEEALEQIPEAAPDLVLIDLFLPGMSGMELVRRLSRQFPDLRTLIVSAHDESLYAPEALRAGASGYVMKQGGPDVVLEAIRRVLRGERYLSEEMRRRL